MPVLLITHPNTPSMPYLTPTALYTRLYAEIVEEISRGDNAVVQQCLDAATGEARLYLSRFDTDALLGTETLPPTVPDPLLEQLVTAIACWNLVQLADAGAGYNEQQQAYKSAVATLSQIKNGILVPDNWPLKDIENSATGWNSNPKQRWH